MNKCVLIFDDDTEILFLCNAVLKNDYRVITSNRCDHVIDEVGNIKPDLILMDLWIPNIGGAKATEILKETNTTAHVPIILFSANADIKDIALSVKANGYLEKPFDIKKLKETIEQYIL